MTANEEKTQPPDRASVALISGWLLLFGVRSLIVTPLMWDGMMSLDQIAALDSILLRIYLVLFALTCLVAALRFVRRAEETGKYRIKNPPASVTESET